MDQTNDDISPALITYGLISPANQSKLEEWFEQLFTEVQGGNGSQLVSSSIAGRTFNFAPGASVQSAFNACARALRVLGGRQVRKAIYRF